METTILTSSVSNILERDLNKVITEINAFHSEDNMWILDGQIKNTAGNLALHIAGAVHHFIGAVLGNKEYIRQRDNEFNDKNVPKEEVIAKVNAAIAVVKEVLPQLHENDMEKDFPEKFSGKTFTIGFFLIHLVSHVNYHLGQINYHRRIFEKI